MAIERRVFLSRVAWRLMFAAGAAALLAGCSDASRFSDPFSDPFQSSSTTRSVDRAPTGTIARPQGEGPRASVQSRPLPPPQAANQSAHPTPVASPAPQPAAVAVKAGSYNHWSAEGGTPVVVADGETAGQIATRYGVPAEALLRVNGFAKAGDVHPGTRLLIPVYRATSAKAEPAEDMAPKPAGESRSDRKPEPHAKVAAKAEPRKAEASRLEPAKPAAAKQPTPKQSAAAKPSPAKSQVAKADDEEEEVAKPAKAKNKSAQAEPAQKPAAKPRLEQTAKKEEPKKREEQKPLQEAKRSPAQAEKRETVAEAPTPVHKVDKTPTASIPPQQEEKPAAASAEAARPEFRWPARGRIIQGFNSGGNDGINISVPEGTQVKAAEGGVVAYAGSELKGYGNLVLIRHPNGFVSAYAHNGEIEVKRGDQVKRGQTIAKSGQSGNVGSPQLHFELRKGSTPVDPTNYLAGL